jgi:hypothetical protein
MATKRRLARRSSYCEQCRGLARRVVIRMASDRPEDVLEKHVRRVCHATVGGGLAERTHFGLAEDIQAYGLIGFSARVAPCGVAPYDQDVKIPAGYKTLPIELGRTNPFASGAVIRGSIASLRTEHVLQHSAVHCVGERAGSCRSHVLDRVGRRRAGSISNFVPFLEPIPIRAAPHGILVAAPRALPIQLYVRTVFSSGVMRHGKMNGHGPVRSRPLSTFDGRWFAEVDDGRSSFFSRLPTGSGVCPDRKNNQT